MKNEVSYCLVNAGLWQVESGMWENPLGFLSTARYAVLYIVGIGTTGQPIAFGRGVYVEKWKI